MIADKTDESNNTDGSRDQYLERAQELKAAGFDPLRAFGIANLENRIRQWPNDWGDHLEILIYGDFEPPKTALFIEPLKITVHPEKLEDTVIKSAFCVLKAVVDVNDKSVDALIEATRRINIFLGAWTLVEWGNSAIGWWSWITHGTGSAVGTVLDTRYLPSTITAMIHLSDPVRQNVEAALFWIREPRNLLKNFYQGDTLRTYAGYWNAFEGLVEAINIQRPRKKLTATEKQKRIDEFIQQRSGKLTPADIQQCYLEIVNPGFVGKAKHALNVCFPEQASTYISECFSLEDKSDRLYQIRNDINHGTIDAENPDEVIRIGARLHLLWLIVWRMFGYLIPFPAPAAN